MSGKSMGDALVRLSTAVQSMHEGQVHMRREMVRFRTVNLELAQVVGRIDVHLRQFDDALGRVQGGLERANSTLREAANF